MLKQQNTRLTFSTNSNDSVAVYVNYNTNALLLSLDIMLKLPELMDCTVQLLFYTNTYCK